jgi:hypothetical protein
VTNISDSRDKASLRDCSEVDYFRTVQRTHTNKDPLIYAATSPHTDVFYLAALTTVTSASTNNVLPVDGVTAPKHVGAVLTLILM